MAKLKLNPKIRKRPSCTTHHPLAGICTRSKSQIYLHSNRSGRARTDSSYLDLYPVSKKPRSLVESSDDLSCILIKDLRSRRVFSGEGGLSCKSCFIGVGGDAQSREYEDDIWRLPSLVPRNNEECNISNASGVGSLNEDCVQTTPPDIHIFIGMNDGGGNGNEKVEFTNKQSNGRKQKNDKRNGTNSRTKSFFSQCSRVKLFKAPGSFSYRRLLPYLTDIAKENSYAMKMGQPSKIEKGTEEKQLSTYHCQEILISEPTSNNVDYLNKSNLTSNECIQESSMSQKEVSLASVSVVKGCSKPTLNSGIEEFEIKISSKDLLSKNSNPDMCLNKNNSTSANSENIVPKNDGEPKNSDAADYCDPQNIQNGLSLIMDKCDSGKDNEVCRSSDDTMHNKTEGLHKSDVGNSPISKNPHLINFKFTDGEQKGNLCNVERRDNDDVEVLNHADNANEECVQMTPPDADIFSKPEVAENSDDHVLWKRLGGDRCSICGNDKRIDSNPGRNLVLKRCTKLKLFKTPGSMSYRRMLPFLMDATKDNSCASRNCNCLKPEKSLDANLLSPSIVSVSQEMPIGSSYSNSCHAEYYASSSSALPITTATASSNVQENNLASCQHVNEYPKPFKTQQKWQVHFEQNTSDKDRKLETAPANVNTIHESNPLATPLYSPLNSSSFRRENAELVSRESYINIGEDCKKSVIAVPNKAKQIEPESLHQDSSQREASFQLDIPVTLHKKGILKRIPRGCRGPCTCLNCSSFRLHAERAFEFSRKQMQGAEEVALDLIKQLSYIRNMLEKSAFGTNGYAAVCVNQVKEACRKASEAEVQAQNRLGQMNFDLDIHCTVNCVQRPRVRFANDVQEKVITESELPSRWC